MKNLAKLKKLSPKWLLLIILLLGTTGWVITEQRDQARTITYVIPAGTSQRLLAGEEVVDFPNELIFTIGVQDTIVIKNQDDAVHAFGPFTILPHTTLTKRFDNVRIYESACTFHQDQQMKITVKPAPWHIF